MDNYDLSNLLTENFNPQTTPRPGGAGKAVPANNDNSSQELHKLVQQLTEMVKQQAAELAEMREIAANPIKQEWMTANMVMDALGISVRQLQTLRDKGELAYSKTMGKYMYKTADVRDFLKKKYQMHNNQVE